MDHSHMRERNYKMVENIRQQNMREQRRLNNRLTTNHGLTGARNYEMANLSYETRKLQQELLKIKQSTPGSVAMISRRHSHSQMKPKAKKPASNPTAATKPRSLSDTTVPVRPAPQESVVQTKEQPVVVAETEAKIREKREKPRQITMDEAQKARYVRHKEKPWFEKELSVQEIFKGKQVK